MHGHNMNYIIREIRENELKLLEDFLYECIFLNGHDIVLPREVIYNPDIYLYIKDFGKLPDDLCLVAECDGKVCGAVWTRIIPAYGHVDNDTPEFAISLYKEYRGKGIGTALMKAMLDKLREHGYKQTSLSVQKANYAYRMYRDVGFVIAEKQEEDYIMICRL